MDAFPNNCLAEEKIHTDEFQQQLIRKLAEDAYERLKGQKIPSGIVNLNEAVKKSDLNLYEVLTAK